MDEDMYLQRLKSIREKYATPKMSGQGRAAEKEGIRQNPEIGAHYPRFQTAVRAKPQQSRAQSIRHDRSHSLAEQSIPSQRQQIGHQPSQKRIDNFNSFIRDLDQRIQEKERILSSRYKANERNEKSKDEREYEICRTISRYSSSKDITKPLEPSRAVPREAYEKSLIKREEAESRRIVNHNIENVLQKKWGAIDKGKLVSGLRENRENKLKIGHQTPLGISKQENLPGDLWSIGKLDSIQQRIKSVLQRT